MHPQKQKTLADNERFRKRLFRVAAIKTAFGLAASITAGSIIYISHEDAPAIAALRPVQEWAQDPAHAPFVKEELPALTTTYVLPATGIAALCAGALFLMGRRKQGPGKPKP